MSETNITREEAARIWMGRSVRNAGGGPAKGFLAVPFGLVALAWAVLHLADRVDEVARLVERNEAGAGVYAPPPAELSKEVMQL